MLALMFMDGADKQVCGFLLKKLHDDFSLGDAKCPEDAQEALQVLQLHANKNKKFKKKSSDEENPSLQFVQVQMGPKCWKCGKHGHAKKDCTVHIPMQNSSQVGTLNAQVEEEEALHAGWAG